MEILVKLYLSNSFIRFMAELVSKNGHFLSFFFIFFAIFSEGGGPKKIFEQKILETYLKNIYNYKKYILDFKNKF